jgi:uncharacterized membrane protein YphA (DoxX/SURF4 family)
MNARAAADRVMIGSGFRHTSENKLAGGLRIVLGLLFVMTGAMKLAVPILAEAWSGQLLAAQFPLYELNVRLVPLIEMAVGAALLIGAYTRFACLVVIGIMLVATYVHVVVDDPSLFPLQPSEPVIPLIVMTVSAYLIWKGGGAGSLDLRAIRK